MDQSRYAAHFLPPSWFPRLLRTEHPAIKGNPGPYLELWLAGGEGHAVTQQVRPQRLYWLTEDRAGLLLVVLPRGLRAR